MVLRTGRQRRLIGPRSEQSQQFLFKRRENALTMLFLPLGDIAALFVHGLQKDEANEDKDHKKQARARKKMRENVDNKEEASK